MFALVQTPKKLKIRHLLALALTACVALAPSAALGDKKKDKNKAAAPVAAAPADPTAWFKTLDQLDYSKIVWPNPPAPTRLKYLNYFSSQPLEKIETKKAEKKKSSWMERMAGGDSTDTGGEHHKLVYILSNPYGMAFDKAGNLYVADGKVGAIFIFNPETKECELIKSGVGVRFGLIVGLAMDDDDTLFVSDGVQHRVLIYDSKHKFVTSFNEGMAEPAGLALDTENRQLYVVDTKLDQVLVYDADTHKLIRKIGTAGKEHRLTSPGNFGMPTNAAVDKDGNLYVTDTWNDRVEVFDADGGFIRAFGKNGDGPGKFARPKGIGIDSDGHVWVADAVQDRLQVFTPEGQLLMRIGGHGGLPGQFSSVAGVAVDHQNRIFTSEIYPGRVQMFRYFTEAEVKAEVERKKAEEDAAAKNKEAARKPVAADTATQPAAGNPAAGNKAAEVAK
jgi:DNA-binding beta-propeller fold protein YncE